MKPFLTGSAVAAAAPEPQETRSFVEEQLAALLDGTSNGTALLRALYDHVLDEPIPDRLRAVLRG